MTTQTQEPQAPTRIEAVADLPDEVRQEIVRQREAGTMLAELKANFPQVAPDVIREVLPAATKREAVKRQVKPKADPKPAAKAEPKPEKPQVDPKVAEELGTRVLDVRVRLGCSRRVLSAMSGISQSAIWRTEQGRVRADEVQPLSDALDRFERGDVPEGLVRTPKAAEPKTRRPSKAELEARLDAVATLLRQAQGDKALTKTAIVTQALAILDPQEAPVE
jgi:transcriptional regulator with XRE-family HTH domain